MSLLQDLQECAPHHLLQSPDLLENLAARWREEQRYWHGPAHLRQLLTAIAPLPSGRDRDILLLTAIYHDAIYDPRASDNEEASARLLLDHAADPTSSVILEAVSLIRASRWNEPPRTDLTRRFFDLDTAQLAPDCPLSERMTYEREIFREFQFTPWDTYHQKRREFLDHWATLHPAHQKGVDECQQILAGLQPRIALYPGSFHPFHYGHLSILRQAETAFDKVIIGLGVNRQKTTADTLDARLATLNAQLPYHEVAPIPGLVTDFIAHLPFPVTIVRGVRDGTDLEAELRYARFLNELRPLTQVVWIACEPHLQHLSSSSIRELESIEPGTSERYIPQKKNIYQASHLTA